MRHRRQKRRIGFDLHFFQRTGLDAIAGHLLSFTGIATYKNGQVIRDCIKACPLEKMMIETDAPFLAPVPHRGKRNEPAFVVEVAKLVAELKGVSIDEVDRVTTENAVEFFSLPARPRTGK
jgi:TatD DNase family protein